MNTVETDVVTAFHKRLDGSDSHSTSLTYDGNAVPVYTGNAPTGKEAPFVVVGRPRKRGDETIDGVETPEVRVQMRVHTAFPEGKGNHLKAYKIAGLAHDLLEASPVTVGGKEPYIPQPDLNPIPSYDKGDQEALDISMEYVFPSL